MDVCICDPPLLAPRRTQRPSKGASASTKARTATSYKGASALTKARTATSSKLASAPAKTRASATSKRTAPTTSSPLQRKRCSTATTASPAKYAKTASSPTSTGNGKKKAKDFVLRLGSDCSGYNAAGLALERLGVQYNDVFLSDIDPKVQKVLTANFTGIGTMYTDVTKRDNSSTPKVDLYTAGFPCQPYSVQGQHCGEGDNRGKPVVTAIINYLQYQRPRAFVLENVSGLVESHRDFFDWILGELRLIVDSAGREYYAVDWDFMDAKDFGVPQSRRRVIIVGLARAHMVGVFAFPEPMPTPSLNKVLEPVQKHQLKNPELPTSTTGLANFVVALENIQQRGGQYDKREENWVADLGPSVSRGPQIMTDLCPCITRARAGGKCFYSFSRGRCLQIKPYRWLCHEP